METKRGGEDGEEIKKSLVDVKRATYATATLLDIFFSSRRCVVVAFSKWFRKKASILGHAKIRGIDIHTQRYSTPGHGQPTRQSKDEGQRHVEPP